MSVNIVWFKRDLRLNDNAAISDAIKRNLPIICLFNLDSQRISRSDVSAIHIEWELDCLRSLSKDIDQLGGVIKFNYGNIFEALETLNLEYDIDSIIANEETGLKWSWDRDKQVAEWCDFNRIKFVEHPSNGVVRKLKNRDNWKKYRDKRVSAELFPKPSSISSPSGSRSDEIPTMAELGLDSRSLAYRPIPGEEAALSILNSFLNERGRGYRKGMSSPITGEVMCSRISPYLSAGCLSIKQVFHHTVARQRQVKVDPRSTENIGFTSSLTSFQSRLAWHCHFMQRLEAEATMDEIAINPELDELLNRQLDQRKFIAWRDGKTGWPFFDACMRYLTTTGWINFRMRAMIMSAASYNLWLPWRETGCHLATRFIDYEPGIHWSQVGMQSGTTGINTIRAYSLSKQGRDQDPEGSYIRKWVPELSNVPTEYIHQPWEMPTDMQQQIGCNIGIEYPEPICDEVESRKLGVKMSYAARAGKEARTVSADVLKKHGSRSRPRRRSSGKSKSVQQKLF